MVTVFPLTDFETYYFEAALNSGLEEDVYGEVLNDTVIILLPSGTNLNGLIASFTCDDSWMAIYANDVFQEPGVTPNDFNNPIEYLIYGPGGNPSLWTVITEIETGQNEHKYSDISIYPNPAKNQLNILNANGYTVSFVTNLGIEVYSTEIEIEKEKQKIDISKLELGIYYLKFENKGEEFVRKLVIEK